MINFNLDLKAIDQILKSPVVISALILILIVLSVIYGISLGSSTKNQVCKEELILIKLQEKQLQDAEIEYTKCVSESETSCIEREQRLCRKDKETIKQNCNNLIESILPGRNTHLDK